MEGCHGDGLNEGEDILPNGIWGQPGKVVIRAGAGNDFVRRQDHRSTRLCFVKRVSLQHGAQTLFCRIELGERWRRREVKDCVPRDQWATDGLKVRVRGLDHCAQGVIESGAHEAWITSEW
ncbi:hypothetical protein GCM10008957_33370 [Deinococcus ruber]|uniref:Uncharacterized protein n=1 Tax=Deinococcus ruber TaxID=1848197 RepID=A0A918CDT8_9DEIO|nr:hypothetical protein GCM10008957_33370 [Deinococcus ruber]